MLVSEPVDLPARLRRILIAHRGRLLDPRRYPSAGPGGVRGATAYVGERLLLPLPADAQAGLAQALHPLLAGGGHRLVARPSSLRFDPAGEAAGGSGRADAWAILSGLRGAPGSDRFGGVGLDHLLTAAEQPGGNPFALGLGRPGLDRYGAVDYPGRGPVAVTWAAPVGRPVGEGGPAVALLDTAVGRHPWFGVGTAVDNLVVGDDLALHPLLDPFAGPAAQDPVPADLGLVGALGSHLGHGTFIAGLLRQGCPSASVHAVAIMGADGVVAERTLVKALVAAADRVEGDPGWAQALVLSLGYYSEGAEDEHYNSTVKEQLVRLARAGVAVFCAAGNDATERPSYPAAFATTEPFRSDPDLVRLVSVAATNPDGTVAEFSNAGPWVLAAARGAALVSTLPTDLDGSQVPVRLTRGRPGRARAGIDPDGFRAGFASWSGTSFAAPVLAAAYLAALQADGMPAGVAARRRVLDRVLRQHPVRADRS